MTWNVVYVDQALSLIGHSVDLVIALDQLLMFIKIVLKCGLIEQKRTHAKYVQQNFILIPYFLRICLPHCQCGLFLKDHAV